MSDTMEIGDAERDAVLASLLRDHPAALISAIDADGLFVDLPASIELGGQQVVQARSALALVEHASRPAIIDAWDRAKATGASRTGVVLDNGVAATYFFVDVRHRHGVFVGLVVASDHEAQQAVASDLLGRPPVLPKTGHIDKDEMAVILDADERICAILGLSLDDLVGRRSLDLVHPEDQGRAIDAWMEMLTAPGGTTRLRARHLRGDGSWVWMELTNANHLAGPESRVVTEMIDVTEEMAALEALRQRQQLLARLADALPSGVLHVDLDRRVLYANARVSDVVGAEPADTIDQQLETVVPDDRPILHRALDDVLLAGLDADVEVRVRVPGHTRVRRCRIAIRSLTDADGATAGAVLCIDDVTEASELRAELEYRAAVDDLTGSLNRAAVLQALGRITEASDGATGTAVAFLDVDGLKEVNDTHGHRAGDLLLLAVAERLQRSARPGDVVGRLGGDEFIVLQPEVSGPDEAAQLGRDLATALAERPIGLADVQLPIRTSIGVSWARGADVDPDVLVSAADRGMYRSKRAGDGHVAFEPCGDRWAHVDGHLPGGL